MLSTHDALDRIVSGLAPERRERYRQLFESAGDTPLVRLRPETTGLPEHDVFLKLEYENDVGCHHRRLYPFVFALYEAEGKIVPGRTPVVEASVGGAACAFAYCARFLGFDKPKPPLAVVQWNASPARRQTCATPPAKCTSPTSCSTTSTAWSTRRAVLPSSS